MSEVDYVQIQDLLRSLIARLSQASADGDLAARDLYQQCAEELQRVRGYDAPQLARAAQTYRRLAQTWLPG